MRLIERVIALKIVMIEERVASDAGYESSDRGVGCVGSTGAELEGGAIGDVMATGTKGFGWWRQ